MPFETKSNFDDKKEYFKNLVVINVLAIVSIAWVIFCGGFSSFYCVVSGADMIKECLKNVSLDPSNAAEKVDVNVSSVAADSGVKKKTGVSVPWHHKYNILGENKKPTTAASSVWFNITSKQKELNQRYAFADTFFKKRADQYVKDVNEGKESFFFSKMWVHGISVFPRLVSYDLLIISEWHALFQKLTNKMGWGTLLMTSFIGFPIFMGVFAFLNACAALLSWGESIIALYGQLNFPQDVKEVKANTTGNIDCSVQTIVKNAIILFCYVFIVPLVGLITFIPTLSWCAMSLLIAPVYALCLPFKIQGFIVPTNPLFGETPDNIPKTTKMMKEFNLAQAFLSNIYSFAGEYLIFFSVLYSVFAGLKQDIFAFIGSLVAVLIIFGLFKWYKSAVPDIPEPETSGGAASVSVSSNIMDQSKDSGIQVVEDSKGDLNAITDNSIPMPVVTSSSTISSLSNPDAANQSAQETVVTPDIKPTESGTEVPTEVPTESGTEVLSASDAENKRIPIPSAKKIKEKMDGGGGAPRNKNKSSRKR